jgi:hypothetical protein
MTTSACPPASSWSPSTSTARSAARSPTACPTRPGRPWPTDARRVCVSRSVPAGRWAFTSVQPEILSVPHSYSNAWGDFDNDGDVDLAVSLGTGEVRLYRNDKGVLVSVGAEVGMPQAGSHELRGLSWGDFDGDGFLDSAGRLDADGQADQGAAQRGRQALHRRGGGDRPDHSQPLGSADQAGGLRQRRRPRRLRHGSCWRQQTVQERRGRFTHVFVGAGPTDRAHRGRVLVRHRQRWRPRSPTWPTRPAPPMRCGATTATASPTWHHRSASPARPARRPRAAWAAPSATTTTTATSTSSPHLRPQPALSQQRRRHLHRGRRRSAWARGEPCGGRRLGRLRQRRRPRPVSHLVRGGGGRAEAANALFRNDGAKGFVNVLTRDSPLNVADHGVQFVDYDNDGALDLSSRTATARRRALRLPQYAARTRRSSAASACWCSTPGGTTRASAPRSGCSTSRAASSPRAWSDRVAATIRTQRPRPFTSAWPPSPRCAWR